MGGCRLSLTALTRPHPLIFQKRHFLIRAAIPSLRSVALACPETRGQDRPVNDSVVPSSGHSAVSPSGHPGRLHPDGMPRDAIPRLASGAALIVELLLSVGLWSLIWLATSALAAIRPW